MSKYKYTVWMEYGFDIETDEELDLDNPTEYFALQYLADQKLREIGLDDIILETTYNNISVEETE
jgi:ribonucleotide reductase beta subunit family protein with ferritin-like domain